MLVMVDANDGAVLAKFCHTGTAGADGVLRPAGRGLVAEPVVQVAGLVVRIVLLKDVDDLNHANPVSGVQPATPWQ